MMKSGDAKSYILKWFGIHHVTFSKFNLTLEFNQSTNRGKRQAACFHSGSDPIYNYKKEKDLSIKNHRYHPS